MKRFAGIAVALAILIGALSSHGKSDSTSNHAAVEPSTPSLSAEAQPSSHPRHRSAGVHYTSCDQNISVGPATTCGFANNVFRAFAGEAASGSEAATVTAVSPATHKTYSMACRTAGGTTLCTGGHSARVRFPFWAAHVYSQASEPEPEAGGAAEGESEEASGEESGEAEECTNGTYENSSGNVVCSPEESETQPAGATARCNDGSWSFSQHHSGTCSSHGGVREWL